MVILSDIFDGFVARHLKTNSPFGAAMDITADFITILTIYILFTFYNLIFIIVLIFISISFGVYGLNTILLKKIVYGKIGKFAGSVCYGTILILFVVRSIYLPLFDGASLAVTIIVCLYLAGSTIETIFLTRKKNVSKRFFS